MKIGWNATCRGYTRLTGEEYAMSQTSHPHDLVGFVIIAVLGVMVIIALHLI